MGRCMDIVYINTGDLLPYAKNNKVHTEDQIKHVANSIQQFGFNTPIIIDEKKEIIAGHCRQAAAAQLGINKVPCVVVKGLSEAQKRAYRIADNKLTADGQWDWPNLQQELEFLQSVEFDLDELNLVFPNPEIPEFEPSEDSEPKPPQTVCCPKCDYEFIP